MAFLATLAVLPLRSVSPPNRCCAMPASQCRSRLPCACATDTDLPARFLAKPELPEEGVVCTVSHHEVLALHAAFGKEKPSAAGTERADVSSGSLTVDLGLRQPLAALLTPTHLKLVLADPASPCTTACLPWGLVERVAKKKRSGVWECYADTNEDTDDDIEEPYKVEGISELTSRTASLVPADGLRSPPTAVLGGFNMHRTKGENMDPSEDTNRKLAALGKVRGRVLDVCTGLGYTSIGAARRAGVTEVVTIELDPLMVYLQRA